MKKRSVSITNKLYPVLAVAVLLAVWQGLVTFKIVPDFMLPSPRGVTRALYGDFPLIMEHCFVTLTEAFAGLLTSVVLGFFLAVVMDRFYAVYKLFHPLMIVSQTVPVIAIAPLLVLWFGYGLLPKILLIIIVCFFPVTVNLLDAFKSTDRDYINLMKAMGAGRFMTFMHVKLPSAMPNFFSALKISVSYSVVGAVISEWLGGDKGLGVYMTRVKKAYAYDKMFAVIIIIIAISLILIMFVGLLERRAIRHREIYMG